MSNPICCYILQLFICYKQAISPSMSIEGTMSCAFRKSTQVWFSGTFYTSDDLNYKLLFRFRLKV